MPKPPNLEKKTEEEKRKRVDRNYSGEQINKLLVSSCQRQPFPQILLLLLHCTLVDPGQRPTSRFLQNPKTNKQKTKNCKRVEQILFIQRFPSTTLHREAGHRNPTKHRIRFQKIQKNHSLRRSWIIFLTRLYF